METQYVCTSNVRRLKTLLTFILADPDRSNPTRNRWERPLDTIRAFEAAIDGNYSRKSGSRPDADSRRTSYAGMSDFQFFLAVPATRIMDCAFFFGNAAAPSLNHASATGDVLAQGPSGDSA